MTYVYINIPCLPFTQIRIPSEVMRSDRRRRLEKRVSNFNLREIW